MEKGTQIFNFFMGLKTKCMHLKVQETFSLSMNCLTVLKKFGAGYSTIKLTKLFFDFFSIKKKYIITIITYCYRKSYHR